LCMILVQTRLNSCELLTSRDDALSSVLLSTSAGIPYDTQN